MPKQARNQALEPLQALDSVMRRADYNGPDPYDGLSSPVARYTRAKWQRQALVQLNKRSPIGLRVLLGIRPVQMAKTLGLVLSAYASSPDAFEGNTEARVRGLIDRLMVMRNPDGGWGYEFDVQMRWGAYPRGTSNIIATSFVVDGLLANKHLLPAEDWKEDVGDWIVSSLSNNGHISYAPTSQRLIHNANLLGAVTLRSVGGAHPLVSSALHKTLESQSKDGSFPYGDQQNTKWIDSFHTAYVLLALRNLKSSYPEVSEPLDRGVEFWIRHCFTADGLVKYYSTDVKPTVDVHTLATTLLTVCAFSHHPAISSVRDSFIRDYFARLNENGYMTNRKVGRPYMRWELAHQLRGLALFHESFGSST